MNEYTASNGIELRVNDEGALERRNPEGTNQWDEVRRIYLRESVVSDALREFFRAERDEELGRWRSKEHPDYFVRRITRDEVSVVEDDSLAYKYIHRNGLEVGEWDDTAWGEVAQAFFDAHPEPTPWHDAKPGEVWVIRLHGGEEFAVNAVQGLAGTSFVTVLGNPLGADGITEGRRIFPESVS